MNAEKESLDNQPSDASTISPEAQECAKFFCNTLASLNKIYEEQLNGLAKIAILLADSSNRDNINKDSVKMAEGIDTLVKQLQGASETLAKNPTAKQTELIQSAGKNPDTFCSKVEAILLLAMQNSVSQQQQAYVTGLAILTAGVSELFANASSKSNESQSNIKAQ